MTFTINVQELENLAISPDIPILGEVAKLKQIGDTLYINLHFFSDAIADSIEAIVQARLPGVPIELQCATEPKTPQPNVAVKKNINNIIAIASGKGGVGKSTTAVNLALAIAETGAKVGILDADIYGPSLPTMVGNQQRPEIIDEKNMRPPIVYGIESNSIGYLVDGDSAVIWRAPMIIGALKQLIDNTQWGSSLRESKTDEDKINGDKKARTHQKVADHLPNSTRDYLDYLIIDLPPGTGDISLSLAQTIPVTAAITVTTPQDIALIDATRSLKMFEKMKIDNLGIIENMSTYVCDNCGHENHIFGKDGGSRIANQFGVPILGEIPLNATLRESLDSGHPLMIAEPQHPISQRYRAIAEKITIELAKKPKSFSQSFGTIAVENIAAENMHTTSTEQ